MTAAHDTDPISSREVANGSQEPAGELSGAAIRDVCELGDAQTVVIIDVLRSRPLLTSQSGAVRRRCRSEVGPKTSTHAPISTTPYPPGGAAALAGRCRRLTGVELSSAYDASSTVPILEQGAYVDRRTA